MRQLGDNGEWSSVHARRKRINFLIAFACNVDCNICGAIFVFSLETFLESLGSRKVFVPGGDFLRLFSLKGMKERDVGHFEKACF